MRGFLMEYLEEYNAVIRFISLPGTVNAFTVFDDENEFYNIYVNERLTKFEQRKAVLHEIEHIKKGHFKRFCDQSVSDIEWGMTS